MPECARQVRRQQAQSRAIAGHAEAEQDKTDAEIAQQMPQVRMQEDGGEPAPPLSFGNRLSRELGRFAQATKIIPAVPVNERQEQAPAQGARVKTRFRPRGGLVPDPLAIFQAVLADGLDGAVVLTRVND